MANPAEKSLPRIVRWEEEGGALAPSDKRATMKTLPSYMVTYKSENRIYENANTFWKHLTENNMHIKDHTIAKEFPDLSEHIHEMKKTDSHFGKLSENYDALEHNIHLMESGTETFKDEELETLKKKRLKLKDELFGMLQKKTPSCCS